MARRDADTSPPAAVSTTHIVCFLSFSNFATSAAIADSLGCITCPAIASSCGSIVQCTSPVVCLMPGHSRLFSSCRRANLSTGAIISRNSDSECGVPVKVHLRHQRSLDECHVQFIHRQDIYQHSTNTCYISHPTE